MGKSGNRSGVAPPISGPGRYEAFNISNAVLKQNRTRNLSSSSPASLGTQHWWGKWEAGSGQRQEMKVASLEEVLKQGLLLLGQHALLPTFPWYPKTKEKCGACHRYEALHFISSNVTNCSLFIKKKKLVLTMNRFYNPFKPPHDNL